MDAAALWTQVLDALLSSERMSGPTIDRLLRPMVAIDATTDRLGGVLLLQAPNEFSRDWAARHYGPLIEEQLSLLTGGPWSLHWTLPPAERAPAPSPSVAPAPPPPARKAPAPPARKPAAARTAAVPARAAATASPRAEPAAAKPAASTGAISAGLRPQYTFEHFVVGPSNQLAHAAAVAMADPSGRRINPLFLCGGTGLGKTHLVNAIGHRLLAQKPGTMVAYVSAEHFTNEFIDAVQSRKMDEFRARYRNACEALLIDDLQFFVGKEQTLDEFFHTFNALYLADKPIVITSDVMPQALQGMPERLVSRFASGLVAEIYPPELETRIAILRKKADLEGIHLDDEAAFALASAVASNMRELEGVLMKLAFKASLAKRPGVDVAMVREVLRIPFRQQVETIEDVQRAVCDYYRVKLAQLTGRDRHQDIALPRQVAMYLARERLQKSFPQIGAKFGGKDHTTVIAAVNKIKKLIAEDHPIRRDIDAISSRLGPAR
jgi:chromosomal replication initiator protein